MKRKMVQTALDQVQDRYIAEAAAYRKSRVLPWIGTAAATLALFIGLQFLQVPVAVQAKAVVLAELPQVEPQPQIEDYPDIATWRAENDQWILERKRLLLTTQAAAEQMEPFLYESLQAFLCDQEENRLYSPVNAYLGLAMTAELTGGETRQQLLDVLGTQDLEQLRSHASALWENTFYSIGTEHRHAQITQSNTPGSSSNTVVYVTEKHEVSTLANSLWLDESLDYNHRPMAALARYYYASVYQQDLSSPQALKDIQLWLNQNTGNSLESVTADLQLPEETLMVLYSSLYFRSQWEEPFQSNSNTHGIFHGVNGDTPATFMNKYRCQTYYYFGKDFGAVMLQLKNGSQMWFLLPDASKSVEDILDDTQYLDLVTGEGQWGSRKYMLVNLSVPKFDVSARADLRPGLETMGITHLFDPQRADFSPSLNTPAYMAAANQTIRVAVDEMGVTAAAYIELPTAGSAPAPQEMIDFILDRPFLFIITKDQIPLFAGVIHQPDSAQ